MKIAVTGAMGTGKSTLVAWLQNHLTDYDFFNVDALVAELYSNPLFLAELSQRFGLTDRKAVAKHVFGIPEERRWLERLATEMLSDQVGAILAKPQVVVEFPLLFEMAAPYAQFDVVVATHCSAPTQRARIHARDQLSDPRIEQILGAQLSAGLKAGFADLAVDTERPLDVQILEQLQALQTRFVLRERAVDFFGSPGVWTALEALSAARGQEGLQWQQQVLRRLDRLHACAVQLQAPQAVELALWFEGCLACRHDSARQLWRLLREHSPALLTPSVATAASELLGATGGGWLLGDVSTYRGQQLADFEVFDSLL